LETPFSFLRWFTRRRWLSIAGLIIIAVFASVAAFMSIRYLTKPRPGKLVLKTLPADANVFVDDAARGTTPFVLGDVAPGERRMRIELQGYETVRLIVFVKPGGAATDLIAHLIPINESTPLSTESPSSTTISRKEDSSSVATPPGSGSSPPPAKEAITPDKNASASSSETQRKQQEIDSTKEEVIRRIDALPAFSAEAKAHLIEKLDRARSMERIAVIPFDRGQTVLRGAAANELVQSFDSPKMRDKLSDPTIILVVAGYADLGGNADVNLRISRERGEYVTKILKERVKLLNAVQTIGMGGTELLGSERPDQNRAVEVWAVVPL
jgi:outer membrane protein OmpA-like peptidoglycan-associated protein